jgi:hypothetical protein
MLNTLNMNTALETGCILQTTHKVVTGGVKSQQVPAELLSARSSTCPAERLQLKPDMQVLSVLPSVYFMCCRTACMLRGPT